LSCKQDILAALAYFDLFDYPLTQTEINQFARREYSAAEIGGQLLALLADKSVFHNDGLYSLRNDPTLAPRRRAGNLMARPLLQRAERIARFLAQFPFVRGVAVSGSLSKNFADENSDIDLFIITAPNRLWLARTLLHLLKKLSYLVNRQHDFCMNYFIDEAELGIREKNIYTATEVATLLPLRGIGSFDKFYRSNDWSNQFLPNHRMRISYVQDSRRGWLQRGLEWSLDHRVGNWLDTFLMRFTAKRWARKTELGLRNTRGIVMSMEAGKHFAKPDPKKFQVQLLTRYDAALFQLLQPSLKSYSPACS
jgi:predicted nucleotidyltransferase